MRLTDKENLEFMKNEERVAAEAELQKWKKEVEETAKLSTQTILVIMPQIIRSLQRAYENLIIVKAKIESEIIQKKIKAETEESTSVSVGWRPAL